MIKLNVLKHHSSSKEPKLCTTTISTNLMYFEILCTTIWDVVNYLHKCVKGFKEQGSTIAPLRFFIVKTNKDCCISKRIGSKTNEMLTSIDHFLLAHHTHIDHIQMHLKGSFRDNDQPILGIDHPKYIHQFMKGETITKFTYQLFNCICTLQFHLYHFLGINNSSNKRSFRSGMVPCPNVLAPQFKS